MTYPKSFGSDNHAGVHPAVLRAIADANPGDAVAYGADAWTDEATAGLRETFGAEDAFLVLNGSGADILELCDGRHTVTEIVAELGARYQTVPDDEVRRFLTRLVTRRCVELADG